MTGEFDVPGYISPKEIRRRQKEEAKAAERHAAEQRAILFQAWEAKKRIAINSTAPKNCVVESWTTHESSRPYKVENVMIRAEPAWYLGGWTSSPTGWNSGYVPDESYHYAIDAKARLYSSRFEIGPRMEFRIGNMYAGGNWVLGHELHGRTEELAKKAPLARILELPGWAALEENQ